MRLSLKNHMVHMVEMIMQREVNDYLKKNDKGYLQNIDLFKSLISESWVLRKFIKNLLNNNDYSEDYKMRILIEQVNMSKWAENEKKRIADSYINMSKEIK